jgi:hypothetical protein
MSRFARFYPEIDFLIPLAPTLMIDIRERSRPLGCGLLVLQEV